MKINMADVNAAIGLAQIREYPKLLEERKEYSIHIPKLLQTVIGLLFRLR